MTFPPEQRGHVFSFEEYVEISERSENRVEHWEGAILDMSGGSPRHSAICNNIAGLLQNHLRGKPCRAFDANLKVRSILAKRATYADVTVVCGALEIDPADRTRQTVLNPTVLIEVLSPSTESDDRGPKLDCYKTIASVRTIVLISQKEPLVVVHARLDDGSWSETSHTRSVVRIDAIDASLPIREIYEDLPDD